MRPPLLLVHGIHDSSACFATMERGLRARGAAHVLSVSLEPNDGSASLEELALQLEDPAKELLGRSGATKLDVVAFSMGTLVARSWIQQLGGAHVTRRFVSISGPHAGTLLAHLSSRAGIRQMRPGSSFLTALERDQRPGARSKCT